MGRRPRPSLLAGTSAWHAGGSTRYAGAPSARGLFGSCPAPPSSPSGFTDAGAAEPTLSGLHPADSADPTVQGPAPKRARRAAVSWSLPAGTGASAVDSDSDGEDAVVSRRRPTPGKPPAAARVVAQHPPPTWGASAGGAASTHQGAASPIWAQRQQQQVGACVGLPPGGRVTVSNLARCKVPLHLPCTAMQARPACAPLTPPRATPPPLGAAPRRRRRCSSRGRGRVVRQRHGGRRGHGLGGLAAAPPAPVRRARRVSGRRRHARTALRILCRMPCACFSPDPPPVPSVLLPLKHLHFNSHNRLRSEGG